LKELDQQNSGHSQYDGEHDESEILDVELSEHQMASNNKQRNSQK